MRIPAGYPRIEDPTAGSSPNHERRPMSAKAPAPEARRPSSHQARRGDFSGRLGELQARRAAVLEPDAEHDDHARFEMSATKVVAAPIEDHPSHRRRRLAEVPHTGARLRERIEPAEGLGDLFVKGQSPSSARA